MIIDDINLNNVNSIIFKIFLILSEQVYKPDKYEERTERCLFIVKHLGRLLVSYRSR